ncbi:hypothetical protein MTER_23590 [Mycolicibacter terrae]|uniref:Uncharacterized protein n=2 Tax=Mycolicibacter terrae TaxID=1788 RepID=A0AAD1MGW9_9MYCO|nr:hypothetical protein MTER_23590 [Mycolicibacter terrae]
MENRLRRSAARQGLRLEKSRTRDPQGSDYGTYQLVDVATNTIAKCGSQRGYGLGLNEINQVLNEGSLSWFHQQLTLHEQIAVLNDPFGSLPTSLAERLMHRPGISMTYWVGSDDPTHWTLDAIAARRLQAVKRQLDDWWQGLTDEQRRYVTDHRGGELGAEYADIVQSASSDPINNPDALVVIVVRDAKNQHRFQLPPLVRAYVEMIAVRKAPRPKWNR